MPHTSTHNWLCCERPRLCMMEICIFVTCVLASIWSLWKIHGLIKILLFLKIHFQAAPLATPSTTLKNKDTIRDVRDVRDVRDFCHRILTKQIPELQFMDDFNPDDLLIKFPQDNEIKFEFRDERRYAGISGGIITGPTRNYWGRQLFTYHDTEDESLRGEGGGGVIKKSLGLIYEAVNLKDSLTYLDDWMIPWYSESFVFKQPHDALAIIRSVTRHVNVTIILYNPQTEEDTFACILAPFAKPKIVDHRATINRLKKLVMNAIQEMEEHPDAGGEKQVPVLFGNMSSGARLGGVL